MSLTGVPAWRNAYFRCLSLWFWKECSSVIKPKDCRTFCVSRLNNSLVCPPVVFWWKSAALLWVRNEVTLLKRRTEGREVCPQKPAAWLCVTQMGTYTTAGETCIYYSNIPLSGHVYYIYIDIAGVLMHVCISHFLQSTHSCLSNTLHLKSEIFPLWSKWCVFYGVRHASWSNIIAEDFNPLKCFPATRLISN